MQLDYVESGKGKTHTTLWHGPVKMRSPRVHLSSGCVCLCSVDLALHGK
jgi:hypothetical protein